MSCTNVTLAASGWSAQNHRHTVFLQTSAKLANTFITQRASAVSLRRDASSTIGNVDSRFETPPNQATVEAEMEEPMNGKLVRKLVRLLQEGEKDGEEGGAGDILPEGFSLGSLRPVFCL